MSENTDLTYIQEIQARDKYRNLPEEKNKKREYGKNRYRNVWRKEPQTKRIPKKLL